jgi:hypothetical protein
MRIYVSDPELVDDLLGYLDERLDTVRERVGEHEVEVSPLGSFGVEGAQLAIDLHLRAWEAAHPGARARRLEGL